MKSRNRIILVTLCIFASQSIFALKLHAEPRSGYEYITPETRAMQDDDFANPGLLTVEHGAELFNEKYEQSDKSCADCHGEKGEKLDVKEIARYPVYDSDSKEIVSLQKRISRCRSKISDRPLETDHPDLIVLETFVRNLARGEIVDVQMVKWKS